jgi:hypothetical protein
MHFCKMRVYKIAAYEMQAYGDTGLCRCRPMEMHAYEIQAYKIQAYKMQAFERYARGRDASMRCIPPEMHAP